MFKTSGEHFNRGFCPLCYCNVVCLLTRLSIICTEFTYQTLAAYETLDDTDDLTIEQWHKTGFHGISLILCSFLVTRT